MADLNLTNVTLTDSDFISLIQRIYQEDFIDPNPFVKLSSFYGNNKDMLNILNKTVSNEVLTAINKSNEITQLFNSTFGNASVGGIKDDFDNIKANLFSESDNINGIKILEYILAQLDPDTYSSLNGLQNDTFDFNNSIGNRILPTSTLDDVDKVLTVDVDGSFKWKEPPSGSGSSVAIFDDDYRKFIGDGLWVVSMDTTETGNPMVWRNELDCGEWKDMP
jgi:hypothetical protein